MQKTIGSAYDIDECIKINSEFFPTCGCGMIFYNSYPKRTHIRCHRCRAKKTKRWITIFRK